MGVAREIGEHRLGTGEGLFGVDHPLGIVPWREVAREGVALGQVREIGKEVQAAGTVSGAEHFQKEALEQPREHAHVQKEPRPAGYPALAPFCPCRACALLASCEQYAAARYDESAHVGDGSTPSPRCGGRR